MNETSQLLKENLRKEFEKKFGSFKSNYHMGTPREIESFISTTLFLLLNLLKVEVEKLPLVLESYNLPEGYYILKREDVLTLLSETIN